MGELASRWRVEGSKGLGLPWWKAHFPNVSSRHLGELQTYWSTKLRGHGGTYFDINATSYCGARSFWALYVKCIISLLILCSMGSDSRSFNPGLYGRTCAFRYNPGCIILVELQSLDVWLLVNHLFCCLFIEMFFIFPTEYRLKLILLHNVPIKTACKIECHT